MRPAGTLRLVLLALAGYASSCAVPRAMDHGADAPHRTAEPVAARAPSALAMMEPTVLTPSSFAAQSAPATLNPTADPDRAGMLAEGAAFSGEIALTFDDGPAAETTTEVLRILAAHKVKGAFFLTGGRLAGSGVVVEMNRGAARAIAAAGHTIGNHGLDHVPIDGGDDAFNTFQIEESARLIAEASGAPVRYFRPPFGKLGTSARAVLSGRGDELVMWTIDGQDTKATDAERLANRLIQQIIFAGQGIVLLHDLRGPSVRALSIVLDWLALHPRYTVVDLPTYLAHAAARPWPYATRVELYHAREKSHAAERGLGRGRGTKPKSRPEE